MKRYAGWMVALVLTSGMLVGCDKETTVQSKQTTTSPGGTTTTTDTHKVESSGKNPPANANGEVAK